MKSIQAQLIGRLVLAMITLSLVSGGALFLILRRAMLHEFDRSLTVRLHVLQSLVRRSSGGKLDVDVFLNSLPEFTRSSPHEFFSIIDADGNQVIASKSANLSPPSGYSRESWEARLPSGVLVRAASITFMPALDDDSEDDAKQSGGAMAPSPRLPLTLTVARDRRPLSELLLRIALCIGASTALFTLVAVSASAWIVRRGLSSLRRVSTEMASLDFRRADAQFTTHTLPAELAPFIDKFNDLLRRVSAAFARERQFTAAVSHELRTPIAELRTAADIALRDPDNQMLSQRAVIQSQEISIQMQAIVSTLLTIASHEHSAEPTALAPLALEDLIRRALARNCAALEERDIEVRNTVSPDVCILANAPLLNAVLDNLIGNAAHYALAGSAMTISATTKDGGWTLTFENEQNRLKPADVERVFEPFWRKETARTDGRHVGLGLTLTRTYCLAMRSPISARLIGGRLRISIEFRQATPPNQTPKLAVATAGAGGTA